MYKTERSASTNRHVQHTHKLNTFAAFVNVTTEPADVPLNICHCVSIVVAAVWFFLCCCDATTLLHVLSRNKCRMWAAHKYTHS